jgi:hypothetical protein
MPMEMVIPENRRLMPPGFTLRGFSLTRCGTLLLSNKYSLLYPLYIHQHFYFRRCLLVCRVPR